MDARTGTRSRVLFGRASGARRGRGGGSVGRRGDAKLALDQGEGAHYESAHHRGSVREDRERTPGGGRGAYRVQARE